MDLPIPEPVERYSFDVLAYEAPFLIEKLLKEAQVDTAEEGRELFTEVKRWMLLTRLEPSKVWPMYSYRVDGAWHQFVLFTNEYAKFCNRYFGSYVGHAPSNAPGGAGISPKPTGSIDEFEAVYEKNFGLALPPVWHDERNINLNRRIINSNVGKWLVEEDVEMVVIRNQHGDDLLEVNLFAKEAIGFISSTKAFYVRELPGDLFDDEKVQLISTMVEFKLLHLAS